MLGPGTTLHGRFVIDREVQRGGMGTLYLAVDRQTDDAVAVKVLGRTTADDHERFTREARALCALDHPAVVRYVAEGTTEEGERYLVMEWLEGEDLAARLSRGPLTVDESVRVVTRVAGALGYAHEQGLVHRDVKPSNLFVPGGHLDDVKLLDFGLVRFLGAAGRATGTGTLLGTPGYLAPEQARSAHGIDARADVFALGCVLFECLTGRAAFQGDSVLAVLSRIVFTEATRASALRPAIPAALDDLVARMLEKEPRRRPRDGNDVVRELAGLGAAPDEIVRPSLPESSSGTRRLLSVVLARAAEEPVDGDTVQMLIADLEGPLEAVRRTVVSHDARLERLADGSVVAVVAGTGAATDQAARAGRVALAMRASLKGWRLALATGLGDDLAGAPVGDAVERAERILGRAGAIAVDPLTAGLLEARFEVQSVGQALELAVERASPASRRVLLGKATPCVGRERERALLRGLFDQCAAEWMPRVALVTGPAGAGKSRLRHELLREVGERAWVLPGQGDDLRAGAPFGVLVPALRAALGLRESDPLEARQEELRARVGQHVAAADAPRVTEFLGELVGVQFPDDASPVLHLARRDADFMGAQMLRAFEDFLRAASIARPVLIVLDDLQWGDGPTVRFVDAALRLGGCPIFVVAFARPEVRDLFPDLWAAHDVQAIALPALSTRASERLVHAVLGADVAPARVRRIVEQASGNAFFLEELIRAEAQGARDTLPETVLAMMHARLSLLPADALQTLCRASVFGRAFRSSSVGALFPDEPPGARAGILDELVALELVHRRAASRFPGETEIVFRHDLIREAAYSMLRDEERVAAHLAAAAWLERSGEVDPAVLARHLERGNLRERAASAHLEAARQSLGGDDLDGAIERAESGVRCGATGGVLAALRLVQGEALVWRGRSQEAEVVLLEARTLLDPGSPLLPEVLAWLASAGSKTGHLDQVVRAAQDLAGVPAPTGHRLQIIRATRGLMVYLTQAGQSRLAEQMLGRIEEWVAASPADPAIAMELEHARAWCAVSRGDYGGFVQIVGRIIEAQEGMGDSRNALRSRVNLGFSLTELGQHERAISLLRAVVDDASRAGTHHLAATAKQNLGLALCRLGELDEARAVLRRSIAEFDAMQDVGFAASSHLYLAVVEQESGALEAAENEARSALEGLRAFPPSVALAQATMARILLRRGRVAEALEMARRAADALEGVDLEEGRSVIHLALVECLDAAGELAAADRALRTAHDWLRACADRIGDATLRESFLERVAANAAIVALARRRLGA